MASTSSEKPVNAAASSQEENNASGASSTDSTSGPGPEGSSAGATPSWSAEFKKRRGAFEAGDEGGGLFEFAEMSPRDKK